MANPQKVLTPRIRSTARRENLTDVKVRKTKPAAAGARYDVWDSLVPGLSLRVTETGRKSWTVVGRVNGTTVRATLGPYPALGVSDARERARETLRAMYDGRRPVPRRSSLTLGDALDDYLKAKASTWKPSHATNVRSAFAVHVRPALKDFRLRAVTRGDVHELLDAVAEKHPVTANRVLAYLGGFFAWAVEREKADTNPCSGIRPPGEERPRDRVYSDPEIRAIWKACDTALGWPYGPFVRFLLVTAQRKGQVVRFEYDQIDEARNVWTSRTKEDRLHPTPLSDLALEILADAKENRRGTFVFSVLGERGVTNLSYLARKIREAEGAPQDFRLHDLRRTAATRMAELGVSPWIVDAVLDHVAGGVTGVYQRYGYVEEMRTALHLWSRRLREILAA